MSSAVNSIKLTFFMSIFPENQVIRLANSGFFCEGSGDTVTCFGCAETFSDWYGHGESFQMLIKRHRGCSPTCCRDLHFGINPQTPRRSQPSTQTNPHGVNEAWRPTGPTGEEGRPQQSPVQSSTVPAPVERNPNTREKYRTLTARLNSFMHSQWRSNKVSKTFLAQLGFFYDADNGPASYINLHGVTIRCRYCDNVTCHFCGLGLRNWSFGDDPIARHQEIFDGCEMVKVWNPSRQGESLYDVPDGQMVNETFASASEGPVEND